MLKIEYNDDSDAGNPLGARVFKRLQNDIINGKYQPGDYLVETKLSKELGVSRTPIREALKQLELEGLVKSIPGKGVVVQGISNKDIEDIYTIRMMIEGLAARWAAENITQEELEELKEILELEEFYTLKGRNTSNLLKLDSRFHDILFRASKSRPLMYILSTFHHYAQRARGASLEIPGRSQKTFEEHKAIFQALAAREPELAERLTTEHVKNATINLMKKGKYECNKDEKT
ncbi:MAG: GntR family transcriptional regulator [Firmicutes bacterium]|nr:GntR family transcriptional regulator [Bacillota bacterium]